MLVDTLSVSRWSAIHQGHSVKSHCYKCNGALTHYRAFEKGSSGFLSRCADCGKEIVRLRVNDKTPFNSHTLINNEIFRRIRKGAGGVE